MSQNILDFVRKGLRDSRARPGWLTIAEQTGVNYSTIWRIAEGQLVSSKISTLEPIAAWLRSNKKKRARA